MRKRSRNPESRCSEVQAVLDLLAAGDLPEDWASSCREHVDSCAECGAEYARRAALWGAIRDNLVEGGAESLRPVDVWPAVQERLEAPNRRRLGLDWAVLEPARALAAAAALTAGLYLLTFSDHRTVTDFAQPTPAYESATVVVTAVRIGEHPARISGFESSDGKTVFLWLENSE